jgi:alpha-galactosidase
VGANLWRTTGDISDNYDRMSVIGFSQAGLGRFAGPGHWNDPDMLEVGNGKMTRDEYLTHMSLWAVLAAPLLAGNDLSKMTQETKSILLNPDVIAIDQDVLGKQGDVVTTEGPKEIWTKPLKGGIAIALFNRGEDALPMTLRLKDVGLKAGVKAKDVWSGETMTLQPEKTFIVPRHGVVLLRVEK